MSYHGTIWRMSWKELVRYNCERRQRALVDQVWIETRKQNGRIARSGEAKEGQARSLALAWGPAIATAHLAAIATTLILHDFVRLSFDLRYLSLAFADGEATIEVRWWKRMADENVSTEKVKSRSGFVVSSFRRDCCRKCNLHHQFCCVVVFMAPHHFSTSWERG